MANQFLNTSWVSMKILRLLVNMLEVADSFNRDWQRDFNKEFAPGSQISVKFPQRLTVSDGMGYSPQAINRLSTPVNLDQWLQIAFEWDDYEAAVNLERSEAELTENYFTPAAEAMAQEWDSRCALFAYQNASNVVGALGTDPTSILTYYQARQRMQEKACPPGERSMNISSSMMATLGNAITAIFHPADELTRMWKKGSIGTLAGFNFFESNSLYSHTAGTWAGTVSVTGAGQSGATLIITGTSGDTIKKGDKFNIASVNQTNPMTRRIPGKAALMQFTAIAAYTLTGGADTIGMLPAIYGPGSQYQNVDALPANAAALTLWPGTTSPNGKVGTVGLALSKFAFAFVGSKLYVPSAVEKAGFAFDNRTQIGVRKVKAWDPVRSMQVNRLDSLGGFGNLYQDNGAVCVAGA
jgi:P22 coat protein - gene protein 5